MKSTVVDESREGLLLLLASSHLEVDVERVLRAPRRIEYIVPNTLEISGQTSRSR